MRLLLYFLLVNLLFACSPVVYTDLMKTYPPLHEEEHVAVIELNQPVPPNLLELGYVIVDDPGFGRNCGWDEVVEKAKIEARKAGGNTLQITEHYPPFVRRSKCHRIVAKILKSVDQSDYESIIEGHSSQSNEASKEAQVVKDGYQKFRVGLHGGWSRVLAPVSNYVPPGLMHHVDKLKTGYHFGGSLTYLKSETIGFGAKYAMFRTSNTSRNAKIFDVFTGNIETITVIDDITVQFIGPAFYARTGTENGKIQFISDFSLGYFSYSNRARFIRDVTLKGETMGVSAGLGFDFVLDHNLAIVLYSSLFFGSLDKFESFTGTSRPPQGSKESLRRMDISIGIRWSK